ncbi:glycoside hydrolase domain-containing protein [Plantactinospora soyae]|uniref:Peptidoglycan hydrolase-like protein with peptidoglycan-binding domain n=1 Tax=Plantactinospora soyae TaxID=1544732 RepID=A0A927ME94_9ACTN|nr:glycoside hydrolase domain-containing protein [Plantactinospora soyae]MBE1491501.1 peptidoglycan hydrolase-like protein with peptidoglycan-binding domain [Plantactinospora soyae]
MADEMVRLAQRFINSTYSNGATLGISKLEENGQTGWTTMYALTRALQHELGITSLSDTFGPTTLSTLRTKFPSLNAATVPSWIFGCIIQSALYCKGYDGGGFDGIYNSRVAAAVTQLKQDMGVAGAFPGSSLEPKVVKGLFNMDAYVVVNNGSGVIRAIQQWLNGRYVNRSDFFIIPCDGHHSRDVAKSMLLAIQYELGMADGVANGVFGPGTQAGLRSHPVAVGSTGVWAQLFTAAMNLNKRSVPFGNFTTGVQTAVRDFQSFAALPVNGTGDFQTWASLLVSYGDQSRRGTANDGVTKITPARAQALKAAGYKYIGRYLYNPSSTDLPEKQIQPGELATIKQYGLRCFPIYQTWSRDADYFHYSQGCVDASNAIEWARIHGFKPGSIIYFAVDYDAMDHEVTDYILPHFRGVYRTIGELSDYGVGVYGPRNVCQRVSDAGYAATSFVSDMSSGFSGNLGYPLPTNWAFDQIATITIGSGDGRIEIDNNIASGRDTGQGDFDPPAPNTDDLDVDFDRARYRAALLTGVQTYLTSIGVPETGGEGWKDNDWVTYNLVTTTEAFNYVMEADWLFTNLARTLKLRKALIQAPVMWELRKLNPLDPIADDAVRAGLKDDSSTGWGQIFAWVTIAARNYCIQQGIINGMPYGSEDTRGVWDLLQDPHYNIPTAAYLTIYNAHQLGIARPSLTTGQADTQALLARYNGTGDGAAQYGRELIGLYNVLENYNRLCRV